MAARKLCSELHVYKIKMVFVIFTHTHTHTHTHTLTHTVEGLDAIIEDILGVFSLVSLCSDSVT